MMMPENGHRAHGFSSAFFLDSDEILRELDLEGDETFMDAGCGDGHNAIKVLEDYNHRGTVYAVDVFHGFKSSQNEVVVVEELKRLIKGDGKIAIVDFNPIEIPHGPPMDIKSSPERLEELFVKHGLKRIYLNDELGADYPNGKSHYMIIFKK